jgi:transposase
MEDDLMAQLLVTDDLWELIEPLLPTFTCGPKGGHPAVDNRVCLTGILFVLKTGIPWEDFPQEMGCCGMTLWNRLADWKKAGVWQQLHDLLLSKLRAADMIDFSRVIADSSSVRAVHGGKKRAPAPWTVARPAPSTTC